MPTTDTQNPYRQTSSGAIFAESRGFTGVNTFIDPQEMSGDMLLVADNVVNNNGIVVSRSGMVGRFGGTAVSSIFGQEAYSLTSFDDGSGNLYMLCVSGGKLYKTLQGSGTYTELKDTSGNSYAFNSAVTDCTVAGGYAFPVDGAHAPVRVNLSGGFPSYTMNAPVDSPTVTLTDTAFDAPTAGQYAVGPVPNPVITTTTASFTIATGSVTIDVASSAAFAVNQIVYITDGTYGAHYLITATGSGTLTATYYYESPDSRSGTMANGASVELADGGLLGNSYFDERNGTDGGQTSLVGSPWLLPSTYLVNVSTPDYGPNSLSASVKHIPGHNWALLLDNPGDAVDQIIYPPANISASYPNPSALTKCANFTFTVQGILQQAGSQASVTVSMVAFNSGGGIVAGGIQSVTLYPTSANAFNQMTAEFSFNETLAADPDHYYIYLQSGPKNVSGNGVYLAGVSLAPFNPSGCLTDVSGSQVKWTAAYPTIGGTYFVEDHGSGGKSYANVGVLAFAISSAVPLADIYMRMGFVEVGQTTIYWSNDIQFSADGTYAYVDITTIPAAVLASVRYFYMQAVLDLPSADISAGTSTNVLTFGPFTEGGNLTANDEDTYTYYVTEVAVIDSSDQIQSNPSASSSALLPTPLTAQANVVLPADCPKNSPTTHYILWRLGGAWSDSRQIAMVPIGSDVTYGADSANPYYSWNHTTKTFLDNTPDLWLTLANLMSFGRSALPPNAQAVATFQGRNWYGVGNLVYYSWLYNADNSDPLYTTLVQNTDDPNYPIEGGWFPVSSDTSDTIVRMIPFGTPVEAGNQFGGGLLVLNKRSVFVIQGTDASNFNCKQYDYALNVGLIAFRGVARITAEMFVFMGPDRLHVFPPNLDSIEKDVGLKIQPNLYPAYPQQQTLQNQSDFALSWMLFHNSALYIGTTIPGGTANSVIWIYNYLTGGWTRWTGMATTSAISMPPQSNGAQYELYLYGLNGQLSVMQGTTDISVPGATAAGITFTVTVHVFRCGFFYRYKLHPTYYSRCRVEWCEVDITMTGAVTLLLTALDPTPTGPTQLSGHASSKSYTMNGIGKGWRYAPPPGLVEAMYCEMTITGTVTTLAYIRGTRAWISGTSTDSA